jgi:cytidylate kinase
MKYRILTVSRECGSGGAEIARQIAERLGWTLLDAKILTDVARAARVDIRTVAEKDERVESWFHWLNKNAMRAAAVSAGLKIDKAELFDAETMAAFTREAIEQAYTKGDCVIVGRGSQCILAGRTGAFHVFIYGSAARRLRRIADRIKEGEDPVTVMRAVDERREQYIARFYDKYWREPHLYDLMISSDPGEEETAATILFALGAGLAAPPAAAPLAAR